MFACWAYFTSPLKKIQQEDMGAVWDVPSAFQKPPHSHAVNQNLTAFSLNKTVK